LDKGDNDPVRFFAYLVAALQKIPGLDKIKNGESYSKLFQTTPTLDVRFASSSAFLTSLINEIAECSELFTLILDDFHVITEQEIHNAVLFIIDNRPLQMNLIVSGRSDPPWPLARLRSYLDVIEVRDIDLRFTTEEAALFMNDVMELNLTPEQLAVLEERTEGWIAGLQMAALSLYERDDASSFIRDFGASHRFILDYLLEEVLDRQSGNIQEFLLKTSILNRLTASLCDAILGINDSQAILNQLDQANLFLVPLDDERCWYRYHHLFTDMLRSYLDLTYPNEAHSLHIRASEWYERNELISEAVSHALAAGDTERLEHLVIGNAFSMMDHGEIATVVGWLDKLPDEVVNTQPWLCVVQAWASAYAGRMDDVEPLLQNARNASGTLEDEADVRRISGYIAAIDAYTAYIRADRTGAERLAREALDKLPDKDAMARGFAATMLGISLRMSGDLEAAEKDFNIAISTSQALGDSHVAVTTLCDLAGLQIMQGKLHEATNTCQEALLLGDEHFRRSGWRLPVLGHAYGRLSQITYEWNDLEATINYATKGIELSEQGKLAEILVDNLVFLATARQAIGDWDGASNALKRAKRIAHNLSPWYAFMVDTYEIGLRLAQGDEETVDRWVVDVMSSKPKIRPQYGLKNITLIRALIAQNRLNKAWEVLARPLEKAEEAIAMSFVIKMLVLKALILRGFNKVDQAVITLERALSLAEPEGFVRTFLDEGEPVGKLLRKAVARGAAVDYGSGLLAALEEETEIQIQMGRTIVRPLVDPLSERELEVMRLLTTHLSSTDIARELTISVNTVRTHIKNIYSKLDVHSREEAVQKAEKLHLL
jgi:LuxR family maltose regulon positive regulatory protein